MWMERVGQVHGNDGMEAKYDRGTALPIHITFTHAKSMDSTVFISLIKMDSKPLQNAINFVKKE
jgi:hypothetical protein